MLSKCNLYIRCFIYKAGNIEEHFIGVSSSTKTEIMRDTFWAHESETLSTGLIDVKSEKAFGAFEVNLGRLYQ